MTLLCLWILSEAFSYMLVKKKLNGFFLLMFEKILLFSEYFLKWLKRKGWRGALCRILKFKKRNSFQKQLVFWMEKIKCMYVYKPLIEILSWKWNKKFHLWIEVTEQKFNNKWKVFIVNKNTIYCNKILNIISEKSSVRSSSTEWISDRSISDAKLKDESSMRFGWPVVSCEHNVDHPLWRKSKNLLIGDGRMLDTLWRSVHL